MTPWATPAHEYRKPEAFVPTVLTAGLVRPLGVYAASHKTFDVMVGCEMERKHALALIFTRLPLKQHGWNHDTAKIELVRRTAEGFPVWRVSR